MPGNLLKCAIKLIILQSAVYVIQISEACPSHIFEKN